MNAPSVARAAHAGTPPTPETASRLRGFHPGWLGAVMGTAIVGVAAEANPGKITALASASRTFGQAMVALAIGLAIVLGVPYVARWVKHPDATLRDLRDPVVGALYGTFPGAILVLAAGIAAVGPSWWSQATVRDVVAGLAWVGVPLALALSIVFAYLLFLRSETAAEAVNGAWFIPPVVNIVVPLVLAPLAAAAGDSTARLLVFMSYAFWGMGFVLYLLILAMLHHRLVLHPLPHAAMAPSLWIGLGPIGVGAIALVKTAASATAVFGAEQPAVTTASKLAAAMLWGFGVWWLAAALLLLRHYLRSGGVPYGLGWWGFTFPLGAYTVATLTLARAWNISALEWTGVALFVLLTLFWLTVAARTMRATWTGDIFRSAQPALPAQAPSRTAAKGTPPTVRG